MVDVNRSLVPNYGEKENHNWEQDESLKDLLVRIFPRDKAPDSESSRWPYNFHAANLHHMGDFKIVWTERLQDHLVIDETSGTIELRVYHHACVLDRLRGSNVGKAFPSQFLEETLQSLAVLLPKYNPANQRWINRECRRAKKNRGTPSTPLLYRKSLEHS
jgi:hypothetical protein